MSKVDVVSFKVAFPSSPVWMEKPHPVIGVGLALFFSHASLLPVLDPVADMLGPGMDSHCVGCQLLFCNSKAAAIGIEREDL